MSSLGRMDPGAFTAAAATTEMDQYRLKLTGKAFALPFYFA